MQLIEITQCNDGIDFVISIKKSTTMTEDDWQQFAWD